jgi:hypothetical protein
MPKGEKIRTKQEMDQLPLEKFENRRIEFCFVKILQSKKWISYHLRSLKIEE